MTSSEKIESYLVKLSLSFQQAAAGTWVVKDSSKGIENLLIILSEPLVILRLVVMSVPPKAEKLFEELLRLNASDMVHGAYALDGRQIVIVDTLEAETLDLTEFEASIDAIGLAVAQHYRVLSKYRVKA